MSLYGYSSRPTFISAVSSLIGHMVAAAVLFITIMAVTWSISWAFSYLNEIHQFPDATQKILTVLEVILVGIDALLCIILILFGAKKFVYELQRM